MRKSKSYFLILSGVLFLTLALTLVSPHFAFAQGDAPVADTPTTQPTPPDTATPEPPAPTPTNTTEAPDTPVPPTNTPEGPQPTRTPEPPAPVSIPEPITVVLFGTGLAALSAAAASRRKNGANDSTDKSDE